MAQTRPAGRPGGMRESCGQWRGDPGVRSAAHPVQKSIEAAGRIGRKINARKFQNLLALSSQSGFNSWRRAGFQEGATMHLVAAISHR